MGRSAAWRQMDTSKRRRQYGDRHRRPRCRKRAGFDLDRRNQRRAGWKGQGPGSDPLGGLHHQAAVVLEGNGVAHPLVNRRFQAGQMKRRRGKIRPHVGVHQGREQLGEAEQKDGESADETQRCSSMPGGAEYNVRA